ncbi:family 1 encapsulin nanocompartment shell protein [Actinomadura rupiterrae]|uniref:family 1 encapsulin nanocompartment shell protein n=1 Tax=Actinomadura rupiterrae TaxID=559627 RepID=UPI0020A3E0A2|nr:family 1 encapsulin nanocompartment shell protein [Actinomadura rupiterrae]MCP2341837.1 putative linocin/CFP29 family protein [Actinomadura rupiterrae]
MNNLHRELAPISGAAWADMEEEIRRTFKRNIAGRRLVDVPDPAGPELAAVTTGYLDPAASPADGVTAELRTSRPVVRLTVPFTVSRKAVDAVERGAKDADWQPAKDAATKLARAEDRAVFHGYEAARITGIAEAAVSVSPARALPAEASHYPDVVAEALGTLRLAGVNGPYALVLGSDAYTAATQSSDQGYPVYQHLAKLLDGGILWAPAVDGAVVLSTRGGDYQLSLGQDLSVGYTSHTATDVTLYLEESFTFLAFTAESAVALTGPAGEAHPTGF